MTQQPILVSISKIIRILRDEGSLDPGELLQRVGSPRKTFYRALDTLQEAGVVIKKDGKHYWYEFLDARVYANEFEARRALEHSKNIASGLEYLLGRGGTYDRKGELMPNPEYIEPALMHLKTAYNQIHEAYQKAESFRQQAAEMEIRLETEIRTRLLASSSLQTRYPENVAKIVLSDIKEALRGHKPYFLQDLNVQDKEVKSGAYTSLVENPEMFDSLKLFMRKEEAFPPNIKECTEIVELEGEYYNSRLEFEKQITNLIMQVKNGTPLRGRCNICPNVRIISYLEEE